MSALADNRQAVNLVVGLGRTGFSVARHLVMRGEPVAVVDSRPSPPLLDRLREELPQAEWLGAFPASLPADVGRLIVSPGVASNEPLLTAARRQGVDVLGDVELFARLARAPLVAVTGSNGKSTVVSLLAHLLDAPGYRVVPGGNLGRPALELLEEDADLYVLEVSSFQLETTRSLDAAVGVILNLSPDHLDRHGDMAAYAGAKARLAAQSRIAVLNRDDERVAAMAGLARRIIWFGAGEPAADEFGLRSVEERCCFAHGERVLGPADLPGLPGGHNRLNVLAALAAVHALGLDPVAALARLGSFHGLPHRMALVAERDGVRWINDSKATNLGATLAALAGLSEPVVLIAGGQGKGQDFTPLRPALAHSVRAVVLMGEAADALAAQVPEAVALERATDMDQAVTVAAGLARPGDTVLLSPACASFDLFDGFEARGRAFEQAVLARGGAA
ncbi:UDP-N-acetylmuramoyl-L-alanine--D-glutamate ligase [Natronospira bacteriovora]|uniref:UDP-N-acetylmuramoylalanine--D-glutamate ligase n=1 Tax=Natronospira bacteriovora TaxID=3069753 RepID=A0ABU0W6X6_9GAMM|nr:UDP-N-acetylmuramoyl-L-alanine--D-glutamate ligase [Natronospira sp. AB-CW4]MDQ2069508.1 UDP-N-acetylmuramoyl-L-alanine--D-glutamate ligase [Natronospira sp. AB-CW4]